MTNLKALITFDEFEALLTALETGQVSESLRGALKRIDKTFEAYEPRAVQAAQEAYQRDGEVEIDDGAVCSRGDDPGLYVQAWVWVSDYDL